MKIELRIWYEVENKLTSQGDTLDLQKAPKKCKILVIDDELEVREILAEILTEVGGHQVTITQNGSSGIEAFLNDAFDVVITDLSMPGMTGWEVAKKIKEVNTQIPIILATGWGAKLDEERLRESQIDLVIAKPFRLEQMIELINEALSLKSRTLTQNEKSR